MSTTKRPTRQELAKIVMPLRKQEFTAKQIAEKTGLAIGTVRGTMADPTGEKERARKKSYDVACPDCGGPMSSAQRNGKHKGGQPLRCHYCARGIPMSDRRRPSDPSKRRCVPIQFGDIPIEIRLQAAREENRHERFESEKLLNFEVALFPSSEFYWVTPEAAAKLAEWQAAEQVAA